MSNSPVSLLIGYLFVKGNSVSSTDILSFLSLTEEKLDLLISESNELLAPLSLIIVDSGNELLLTLRDPLVEALDPLIKKEQEGDLTSSMLQTLTLVAYLKNPTKYDISFMRGVSSHQTLSSLLVRNLIQEGTDSVYDLTPLSLSLLRIQKKEDLPDYHKIQLSLEEKRHGVS